MDFASEKSQKNQGVSLALKKGKTSKQGFTMVELLVVIVIVAVLAAVAVPAVMYFIDSGKQTARMNVARTIFLAAQDRFTELRLSKNLKAEFTSDYYTVKDGNYTEKSLQDLKSAATNVYTIIGDDNFPAQELVGNKAYVHYISKPRGEDPLSPVVKLLDPVILDKSILNEAIVIEYNIKTGLVLSAFFSDTIKDGEELTYNSNPADMRTSIYGRRPYLTPADRKQGYYGVGYTGTIEESLPANINVWDSSVYAMPEEVTNATTDRTKPQKWKNFLYAQIIVPKSELVKSNSFTLSILNGDKEYSIENVDLNAVAASNGVQDDSFIPLGKRLYKFNGTNGGAVEEGYERFIWILDYVGAATADTSKNYSIAALKDTAGGKVVIDPKNGIKVKISGGVNATSFTEAHPYHGTSARKSYEDGRYSILTARHLYNIRYNLTGNFIQKNNIVMDEKYNKVTNFEPIAGKDPVPAKNEFTGTYTGTGYAIENLSIDSQGDNTGLFAVIGKNSSSTNPIIKGVTLENPSVIGKSNTGAIGGTLKGFISNILVRYSIDDTSVIQGATTGGLIGVSSGSIMDSTFVSPTDFTHVVGTKAGGFTGTLETNSKIKRNYFLALAPVKSDKLHPFTGDEFKNEKNEHALYYLSGKGVRPSVEDYNLNESANEAEPLSTPQFVEITPEGWENHKVSEEDSIKTDFNVYPYGYTPLNAEQIASPAKPTDLPDWPIVDNAKAKVKMLYYEVYGADPTTPVFGEDIEKAGSKKLVVNEGYALEFAYARTIEFTIGLGDNTKTYKINETANSDENPVWEWDSNNPTDIVFDNYPMKFTVTNKGKDETVYRIFLNNTQLKKLASGNSLIDISVKTNTKQAYQAKFNPLYANTVGHRMVNPYLVRSPRQLDNVDEALASKFEQQLNLDFNVYRTELEKIVAEATKVKINDNTKPVFTDEAVVKVGEDSQGFSGIYDGKNNFIINVKAQSGLFYAVQQKGEIKNFALLKSEFTAAAYASPTVGSIAAENSGSISRIEVSEIIVRGGTNGNVGGFVGVNSGSINNCYFNSTYRNAQGIYSSSVMGSGGNMGGLVGKNEGVVEKCYTTGVGPNNNPISGNNGGSFAQVYYLVSTGYNSSNNSKVGIAKEAGALKTVFSNEQWQEATTATTKDLYSCSGAYPFPKLIDIDHFYDWPILQITFKYYERYNDLSYGYYYFVDGEKPTDTLKYDPDYTVIEEGYMIELLSDAKYRVKMDAVKVRKPVSYDEVRSSTVMDGRRVIKLYHDDTEVMYDNNNDQTIGGGLRNVKIQASLASNPTFINELLGKTTSGNVYFNPLFAKAINLSSTAETSQEQYKNFEVRSPRQMLQLANGFHYIDTYVYKQTISINFFDKAGGVDAPGSYPILYYSRDQQYEDANINSRSPIAPLGRNIAFREYNGVGGVFYASYDGACSGNFAGKINPSTGRLLANRIYSMELNVANSAVLPKSKNVGSAFGKIGDYGGIVKNLEFVDPQIRFEGNGYGGGIVADACSGTIENVNVYNEQYDRSLFANKNGKTDTYFCGTGSAGNATNYSDHLAHAHGGITGYVDRGKVINCIVGSLSNELDDIINNKTKITCRIDPNRAIDKIDDSMITIGGIAGEVANTGEVIACTNISTVIPNAVYNIVSSETPHNVGGIAGRLGGKKSGEQNRPDDRKKGTVVGCYNTGTVIAAKGYVGGIVGRSNASSEILSSYNAGRVNIETVNGKIVKTTATSSIRIGGIVGEANAGDVSVSDDKGTAVKTCYNIGYISDNIAATAEHKGSGTIIGYPYKATASNGRITMSNVFSLKADLYAPKGIIGEIPTGVYVNGKTQSSDFATWESRLSLRNNKGLVDYEATQNPYPFVLDEDSAYYYPQMSSFTYGNVKYSNPHLTPWEYIDAYYDTTIKYYERYNESGNVGEYYRSKTGDEVNTLEKNQTVKEDGYFLEIGQKGTYKVVVGANSYDVTTVDNLDGLTGRNIILFTDAMKKSMGLGYNKVQLFTKLPEKNSDGTPNQSNKDDNAINRIISSTSTASREGVDVYFDYYFPREIQYGTTSGTGAAIKSVPPPVQTKLFVRSPRHIDSLSKLTGTADKTKGKTFTQEVNIEFKDYAFNKYTGAAMGYTGNYKTNIFAGAVAKGEFMGTYNGTNKAINNAKIAGAAANTSIGLFEKNSGIIQNLKISNASYTSASTTIINAGLITAENSGTINRIAIEDSLISGAKASITEKIGGAVGINNENGKITNLYFVNNSVQTPVSLAGAGTASRVGGIVGVNKGSVDYTLYLAKAPSVNPISGENTGKITDNVLFLAGVEPGTTNYYNNIDPGATGGQARSTSKLSAITNWSGWGIQSGYPYPNLSNIAAPTAYPLADDMGYKLAYFEKYEGGAFGWFFGEGNLENSLRTDGDLSVVDNTVLESGYAAIVLESGKYTLRYTVDDTGVQVDSKTIDGKEIVELSADHTATKPADMARPIRVSVNSYDMEGEFQWYNPLFGRAVYNKADEVKEFAVRTPQQMQNISLVNQAELTFTQDLDLDFTNTVINEKAGAVVTGEFTGKYLGESKQITGLKIDAYYTGAANQGLSNVGIFSTNRGVIDGIVLAGSQVKPVSIIGNSFVGGITGHNLPQLIIDDETMPEPIIYPSGTIMNCTVQGDENGKGLHIEARRAVKAADDTSDFDVNKTGLYAGGIAGQNGGEITGAAPELETDGAKILNCTVKNTIETIKGFDFVAGITAINGKLGVVKNPAMSKVKIEVDGVNAVGKTFGIVIAKNNNRNSNDVVIDTDLIKEVDIPTSSAKLALMEAVEKAKNLEITEGVTKGAYIMGTQANLNAYIVKAESVLKSRTAKAEQYTQALTQLNTARDELKDKLLYGIVVEQGETAAEITVENQAQGCESNVSVVGNKITVKPTNVLENAEVSVAVQGVQVIKQQDNTFVFTMPEGDVVINILIKNVQPTEKPETTEKPTEQPTQLPEATDEPAATIVPDKPVDSPTDLPTQVPQPTQSPEATDEPSATIVPDKPVDIPTELPTQVPQPTQSPEATDEPSATIVPDEPVGNP